MSLSTYYFRTVLLNLTVAAIYFVLAKSGMLFANNYGNEILWWPSGGFALAILLLNDLLFLPGIYLGALLSSISFGNTLLIASIIALGNSFEIIFGWWLLSRCLNFDVTIKRLHDFLLILLSSPLIAMIGAVVGFTNLMLRGALDSQLWLLPTIHWWMADFLGIVLVTPLILVWKQLPDHWLKPKRMAEVITILGLSFLAGQAIFFEWYDDLIGHYPKAFMMFLFLSITAIRLGRHGVQFLLVMTAVQALLGASRGVGYFGEDLANSYLGGFWLFMLIMSIVGMVQATYIREKNQAVIALQESQNQFRTLANNASVLVWMSGTDAQCTYFNQVWLDFTGRSLQQELGSGWSEGVHPEDLRHCMDSYMAAFDAHAEFSLEYRLRRYDGNYRWIIDHGVPRFDNQGKFRGYIGSVFDITERKNAETAMFDSEIRFRKLLEQIPLVSVQGYTEDGVTNYWNQASVYLYGYTAEEAIGEKLTDLIIPPKMRDEVKKAMRQMFATGQPIPASELTLMRKGGGRVDVFSSHAYVHVPGREPEMFCMDIDLTERKRDEERIRNLAFYDPLTQLPNRRLLLERLQQALVESHRSRHHGAILFFDLDNFKALNDTLGHDKGDLLLQQVAQRLAGCVREIDTVARFGGDEFVVLLKELNEDPKQAPFQAEAVCVKILASLNEPYQLVGIEYLNTASIGIALFADHVISVEDLMKRADIAMYQAKQAGCNTFRFFDPQMQSAVDARMSLEHGLRKALPDNQLKLYYQIQVDDLGKIHGAEVLLRWEHPELGMISPADFIPLAEAIGLIVPVGLWVLENACGQLRCWKNDPQKQHLQLAVNVSARQFQQADFNQQVTDTLHKTGADPTRLKLELTESLVHCNIEDTIAKMRALKQIGITFSMDDFGTGYSSLSCLKKLPIDQLKIDQSFVRNITTDSDDATIVQTIIAMANNLGMAVIAEGVETEQQKAFLIQHNCRHFQGYLFSKPVAIEQFEAFFQ